MIVSPSLFGQGFEKRDSISIEMSSFAKLHGEELPFWIWANNRGKVEPGSSSLLLDIRNLDYGVGKGDFFIKGTADITGHISENSSLNVSQVYLTTSYKGLKVRTGRFFLEQGLNSSDLGIGSMLISRNASSFPGIELSTKSFLGLPYTNGIIKYNIGFGNFWFDEKRYIDNAKLHTKFLYLQLHLGSFKFNGGLIHNVFWGGTTPDGFNIGDSFSDFSRVVFALPSSKDFRFQGESTNALGNTLAAYDGEIEWNDNNIKVNITRLFFLEDKSNIMLRSFWDGQWSVNIELKNNTTLKRIRYDQMYTIRQDAVDGQPGGRANYYGHYLYRSGWTYRERVIGNPFIEFDFENNIPLNNMMIVHALALQLSLSEKTTLTSNSSYKRSYGVCNDLTTTPFYACERGGVPDGVTLELIPRNEVRNDQFQTYVNIEKRTNFANGLTYTLHLGYDLNMKGKDNVGFGVGFKFFPITTR